MNEMVLWSDYLLSSVTQSYMWPDAIWLVIFCLSIAIIRFLNVLSYPERPLVIFSTESDEKSCRIKEVIEKCPILNEAYSPPILWGRSGHLQTATYGMFSHSSLSRCYSRRYLMKLTDGSSVFFDIFDPVKTHLSGRDYTLALCPGIANSSESNYIRTCVHYAQENGFRCAVLNHLGTLKHVPLTSGRIFSYGCFEEMSKMIDNLSELYPSTRFFCIGFSMGANIVTRMIANMSDKSLEKIVAGISISQGYSATESVPLYLEWSNGRRFYNYVITENMKRLLRRNYEMAVAPYVKLGLIDEQRLWSATSILAFDEQYTRRVLGYSNIHDFYANISSLPYINGINKPMIFINAKDDPLIPPCLWEPVRNLAALKNNFGFILTKHGGHLGFLESNGIVPNSITWLDRFLVQFVNAAITVYDENM